MKIHRLLVMFGVALVLAAPAWAQGTLFVEGDNVGIGISTPLAPLHIDSTGGSDNVVRLVRDGVLRYRLENTAAGASWDFNNDGNGNFAVSKVGTGKAEFTINGAGQMGVGCNGADHDFVVSVGGACTATPRSWMDAGDTGFSTSSSRDYKENLIPLTTQGVVDKIRSIPVYEYDFVNGPEDRIGLVAEDFHQVFGRGSDKELSGHEVTMALWLAVQELSAELEALKAEKGAEAAEACTTRGDS